MNRLEASSLVVFRSSQESSARAAARPFHPPSIPATEAPGVGQNLSLRTRLGPRSFSTIQSISSSVLRADTCH